MMFLSPEIKYDQKKKEYTFYHNQMSDEGIAMIQAAVVSVEDTDKDIEIPIGDRKFKIWDVTIEGKTPSVKFKMAEVGKLFQNIGVKVDIRLLSFNYLKEGEEGMLSLFASGPSIFPSVIFHIRDLDPNILIGYTFNHDGFDWCVIKLMAYDLEHKDIAGYRAERVINES